MATVADISQALGDYMLKGWVLTDQSCPTPGCTVPLVRSPRGRTPMTSICVKCGDKASEPADIGTSSNASTETHISRSSTPPTELSEVPESPVFVPVEESEQSRQRREQSDQASAEIGKKLLQGWAMLGDECPNDTCYGVPLVRPPKSGGEKDLRKECVICGKIYVTEVDWAGREILVPYETKNRSSQKNSATATHPTNVSSNIGGLTTQNIDHHFSSPFGRHENESKIPQEINSQPNLPSAHSVSNSTPIIDPSSTIPPPSNEIYDQAAEALQESLRSLTGRLMAFGSHVDPGSIGATADAIGKVASALVHLQPLQQKQRRV